MGHKADEGQKVIAVGITGGSGSGKSTLAKRLQERLGDDVVIVQHDDYYKDLTEISYNEVAGYDFDKPEALSSDLLAEHLRLLKSGQSVEMPQYDFVTKMRSESTRHVDPAPVILLDGLFLMCDPALREQLDFTIFVDVDADVRAVRRIERDCRERAIDLPGAAAMYLYTVKAAHDEYVEPYKSQADIIITDVMSDRTLEFILRALAR